MQSDTSTEELSSNYRSQLEEEKGQLLGKLDEIGFSTTGSVSSNGLDYDHNFADSSQVTAERGEAEALATQLRETLDEVERALEKLTLGTYGTCEICSATINPARLDAIPTARTCIDCASKNH